MTPIERLCQGFKEGFCQHTKAYPSNHKKNKLHTGPVMRLNHPMINVVEDNSVLITVLDPFLSRQPQIGQLSRLIFDNLLVDHKHQYHSFYQRAETNVLNKRHETDIDTPLCEA